jgi:hypothetical protein
MLRLQQALAEQPAATDEVLAKQLRHNELDVRRVDLVDETVDGLLQGIPGHPLVFLGGLIGDGGLQGAQLLRRQVYALTAQVEQLLILGSRGV